MPQITIEQAFALAVQHHQRGQLREAEEIYRQILAAQPNHADAMHYFGALAQQSGNSEIALGLIRQSLSLNPTSAPAQYNLGVVLQATGDLDGAIAAYRAAVALRPDFCAAQNNLGAVLQAAGNNPEAIAAYRRAVALDPTFAEALSNLGNALRDDEQLEEALGAHRQAIVLNPNIAAAHNNLGNSLKDLGQPDAAVTEYRRAVELHPEYAEAHFNIAQSALLAGDYPTGWEEYEWRWKVPGFPSPVRQFAQPLWDGRELNGKVILLYAEQGFGETLQFIRYIPLVMAGGGRVIVEAQPELIPLLRKWPGEVTWIAAGESLPAFDVQCPLGTLPRLFGTTLQSIPPMKKPLRVDPKLAKAWKKKLTPTPPGLKVGLNWAANPAFNSDRRRSLSLDRLAALAKARDVTFYSLQKGPAESQAEHPPAGMKLVNLAPEIHDFADTAAAMGQMDLILTTDASVAQLAGALGRPVWVMLQHVPDWRWHFEGEESPWYPTMRLFRQTTRGDWAGVIARVAKALKSHKGKSE